MSAWERRGRRWRRLIRHDDAGSGPGDRADQPVQHRAAKRSPGRFRASTACLSLRCSPAARPAVSSRTTLWTVMTITSRTTSTATTPPSAPVRAYRRHPPGAWSESLPGGVRTGEAPAARTTLLRVSRSVEHPGRTEDRSHTPVGSSPSASRDARGSHRSTGRGAAGASRVPTLIRALAGVAAEVCSPSGVGSKDEAHTTALRLTATALTTHTTTAGLSRSRSRPDRRAP